MIWDTSFDHRFELSVLLEEEPKAQYLESSKPKPKAVRSLGDELIACGERDAFAECSIQPESQSTPLRTTADRVKAQIGKR